MSVETELEALRREMELLKAGQSRLMHASGLDNTITGDAQFQIGGAKVRTHPEGGMLIESRDAAVTFLRAVAETYQRNDIYVVGADDTIIKFDPSGNSVPMTITVGDILAAFTSYFFRATGLTVQGGGVAVTQGGSLSVDSAGVLALTGDTTDFANFPQEGYVFYRTDLDRLRLYDGSAWHTIATTEDFPMNLSAWGVPPPQTTPIDVTISGASTLTEQVNYFRDLTINSSQTLTGIAGGGIIVCRDLTINSSGIIDFNGLGAKGGATSSLSGYGGGAWGFDVTGLARTNGFFDSASATDFFTPRLQMAMASGAAGRNTNGTPSAGSAWPAASSSPGGGTWGLQGGWPLVGALIELMHHRPTDDATAGAIGGGGGGASHSAAVGGTAGIAGIIGGKGTDGTVATASGGGGSGFGGGGGGAGRTAGGTAQAGGRGGGVLVIVCRNINNAGTIRANGAAAGANAANSPAAGGGGGGAVVVLYETTSGSGVGTLQANGGAAGTSSGGVNGSAGGAGLAASFKIRSGS